MESGYPGGWRKCEPLWDVVTRGGHVLHLLPVLEAILAGFGERRATGSRYAEKIDPDLTLVPSTKTA